MLRIEKFTRKLQKQKNLQSRKKEYKQIILYDMKNSTCLLESLCLNHLCPESFFGVWVFFWVWDLLLFFSWTTGIPPRLWWGQGTICGICNPTNPKARPGRSINKKNNLWCCEVPRAYQALQILLLYYLRWWLEMAALEGLLWPNTRGVPTLVSSTFALFGQKMERSSSVTGILKEYIEYSMHMDAPMKQRHLKSRC